MNTGGKAIPGVSLTIPSAHDYQPAASDARGQFRLSFGEHKVGDVVIGLNARKYGYALVNKHIVEGYTLTDRDSLRIVMAPIEQLEEARQRYYALIEADGIQRYDATMSYLNEQYAQHIITKPELNYWQSLAEAELQDVYRTIDDYADRMARINMDDLNAEELATYEMLIGGDAEAGLALIDDMPESTVFDDYLVFSGTYPMMNPEVRVAAGDLDMLNIPDSLYSDVVALDGYNERYESDFMTNGLHYAQSCQHLAKILVSLGDNIAAAEYLRKAMKMYELLNEMGTASYHEDVKQLQSQIKSLE